MKSGTVDVATAREQASPRLWMSLFVCMGIGPMFLYTLTAISPLVIADLDLSPAEYGAISTVTFGAAALSALLLGAPSSRFGARTVMVAVSVGSIAGLAVLALAESYAVVVVAGLLSGAAQALSNPATNRMVAGLPVKQRGALIGWKQSGVQAAQLVAGLAAPLIAAAAGWRWAVAAGIALGLVGVVSALSTRAEAAPNQTLGRTGEATDPITVARLTAYTFFIGFGLQATNAHLPLFAHVELGLSLRAAGLIAALVGLVGLLSRILWGRRADTDSRQVSTLLTLAIGAALGVVLVMASTLLGDWLVWVGAAVFGAAALASNAVTMVVLVRTVPIASLGTATAFLATGMYVGFGSGPLAFGLTLDLGAGFGVAWLVPLTAFVAAALISLPPTFPTASPLLKGNLHAHP
ncbi:MFS transporter [Nocardioides sp. NBC_00163]|uniref:MFS transporter n=1 Tax=unclassified Nocardioides TaxID=2615069 RepID=UPI0032537DE9